MKKYIHYIRVDLLVGLLSFNALSACLHTRPTLGMDAPEKDNRSEGSWGSDLAIDAKDTRGLTLLMDAVISKDESAIRSLIDEKKANVNIQSTCKDSSLSTYGDTALHLAARSGLVSAVEILLEPKNKIDVNIQNVHGDTPLHLAAYYNHLGVVQCLLEKGPNDIKAHLKNRDGDTFLSLAEKNGIEIKANWVKVIVD